MEKIVVAWFSALTIPLANIIQSLGIDLQNIIIMMLVIAIYKLIKIDKRL